MNFNIKKTVDFCLAARRGDLDEVRRLSLDPEVSFIWSNVDGDDAFGVACLKHHFDVVRYLLGFKDPHKDRPPINYNKQRYKGENIFGFACEMSGIFQTSADHELVDILLEDSKIDIEKADKYGVRPLFSCASSGYVVVMKKMLASGRVLDIEARNTIDGVTALEIASGKPVLLAPWVVERKKNRSEIASLLEDYQEDPLRVGARLRKELGIDVKRSGELFSLVVLHADEYLVVEPGHEQTSRFFSMTKRMPIELQMVLSNVAFGISEAIVKSIHSERGFKKFTKTV